MLWEEIVVDEGVNDSWLDRGRLSSQVMTAT